MSQINLRPLRATDYAAWIVMLRDYDPDVIDEASCAWERLMDSTCDVVGTIAELDGEIAGFMHHVFHEFSLMRGPVCYVADLYVRPQFRRRGIARAMLEQLIERGRADGWTRVYWVTEHGNPARALYDQFAAPDFVRYHLDLGSVR